MSSHFFSYLLSNVACMHNQVVQIRLVGPRWKTNQQTVPEPLDYDPSEGQDWNWEDYEWLVWVDHAILFWIVDASRVVLKNLSFSHEAHLGLLEGSDRTHQHILQHFSTSFNFIFPP